MQNLVTVFGGSGFVGVQTVRDLAKAGWRVRVAVRNPNLAYRMRLLGDVGQVDIAQANIRDSDSIARALAGATAVINLVGVLHDGGRQGFEAVHVEGARNIAEGAKAAGVARLVHVSALGADPKSPSKYARSKAAGEAAVRAVRPDAAIVRPSIIFGPGDGFFERFAKMAQLAPALPLIGGGTTRFQPVFVGDVGRALARIVGDADSAGKTFELGGPAVHSFKDLLEKLLAETGQKRALVPVPWPAASLIGKLGDLGSFVMAPPLSSDQVELLKVDNVVSGAEPGLAELGITPTPVESVLPEFLYTYRKGGQYADQDARILAAQGR